MGKLFFDVFPTLKVNKEYENLFREVEVMKVTTTSLRDFIRVHICSTHLIAKRSVCKMEEMIREQLFGHTQIQVEVVETYQLSELYTPENLLREYRDSILYELQRQSMLEYNMFQNAVCTFEDTQTLCIEMTDSIVAEGKKDAIVGTIDRIFNERCQVPTKIKVLYREPQESKNKKHGEIRIQQEVDAILEQNASLHEEKIAQKKEKTEGVKKKESVPKQEKAPAESKKKEFPKREFQKKEFYRSPKRSDNPDVLYGRDFEDEAIPLSDVVGEMGEITIRGKILKLETREIRNEKTIVMFAITDFTDTIMVKMFTRNEQLPEILTGIKKGAFLKIKGVTTIDKFDGELTIGSVVGIRKISDFTTTRKDTSPEKRVELHCHTKMSDMDGVSEAQALVARAHDWGHQAIAITDHGVVQAFPDANHYVERLDKEDPFKIIYGVEAYLVDDLTEIAVNEQGQTLDDTFVVFDIETTGFSAAEDRIIEIGAVKITDGAIVDRFSTFVNPEVPIPFEIQQLTHITDDMVLEAPKIEEALPAFLDFVGESALVAHNAGFDVGFIEQNCVRLGRSRTFTSVDTVGLARVLLPTLSKYKLNIVAKALNISLENHHRAVDDAAATAEIYVKFIEMLKERGMTTLKEVNAFGDMNPDAIKKMPTYHAIILAKNEVGRVNLYTLVSLSHLKYFARRPRIPKSEFNKYREGLILGSACEAGELYRALLDGKSEETIAKIVDYYDYLEIQPIGNNAFMIASEKQRNIKSEEDLKNMNRRIVQLGEKFQKPVVATCDVHFMDPDSEVYRRIIMTGKGFSDADSQPPLYLRTTEEMLEEFSYLGSKKAEEVVITNTNKIADSIERISPVRPDKCPPVIEDSDQTLRNICYDKAHSMYGEELPEIVVERLERELNSIISNGFAVMYIIAQKLVWKSNEDGYLVGSRGSVGSSFVATMAGITEVNPLSPHYYCTNCHYSDFESEEVRAFAGGCGWDMPDKVCPNWSYTAFAAAEGGGFSGCWGMVMAAKRCPNCGQPLVKDGFDIPFETFLGFKGNKEPDIDLNFSGDYQSNAHKYTEVIFGEGQTYRAGTIGTLAEKTAFGFVKNYYEEHGSRKRKCEIERIVEGCTGIRRSTGQHPGGIIVLPHGENINSFTPVQHPANDMTTDIITTHFDYHSIDHNLLKLDILGHDDPTMIKMLEELVEQLTGKPFKATEIPLDDPGVMQLFADTGSLGIKPSDIGGCPVGCLGIPEFGTDFVIQMVVDTKPKTLSDLIRISGLSHGTDVWLNNAQTLIQEGKATISTAICTRDDIMTYLINTGRESELSFTIMESVRKGKGLKPEWEDAMKAAGVPDWYIWSCKKIKYMFPKAHAAAYVMMAYRIAYCKVNYPLAYYAAYFSIRASAFSYELMCQGKEKLEFYLRDYKNRSDSLSKKDQDTLKDMRIVQEMYARGYEFLPLDIYRAKATKFQIIDGKLMPPLSSIEGMGDKAAEAVEMAAEDGPYLSRDDFRQRTKVSKTVIDFMADLGMFGDLPETNQLSLFDL